MKILKNIFGLSKKNKLLLIDYIRNNLTIETLESRDNIRNPVYIFKYGNHPLFIEYMKEWVDLNYVYDPKDFIESMNSNKPYETKFFKMVDKRQDRLECHLYCINKMFDNIPINKFKFTYNKTNYRPCHNILLEVDFKNSRVVDDTFNIQIRKNDFPFKEGRCYGKNVKFKKSYKLTNGNIDKYCKKIGINLKNN